MRTFSRSGSAACARCQARLACAVSGGMGGLDSVAIRNIFPDVVRHEQSPELGAIDAPSFDHLPCPLLPGPTTCLKGESHEVLRSDDADRNGIVIERAGRCDGLF